MLFIYSGVDTAKDFFSDSCCRCLPLVLQYSAPFKDNAMEAVEQEDVKNSNETWQEFTSYPRNKYENP